MNQLDGNVPIAVLSTHLLPDCVSPLPRELQRGKILAGCGEEPDNLVNLPICICDVRAHALHSWLFAGSRQQKLERSTISTLKQVVETDPAPVRLLNRQVDRDLETICMKCLEKDPRRRYATARALTEDLSRYLEGNSISVRSFNALERVVRSLERSQIDEGYDAWSTILFWWAGIVLVCQLGVAAVIYLHYPPLVVHGMLAIQITAMAVPVISLRAWHHLTASAAQRQLWAIGAGFLLSCVVLGPVMQNLMGLEKMYEFYYMPPIVVLSGLCLFILGSNYWGWLYGMSLLFFVWAYACSFNPPISPVGFGILWSSSLALIAWRLRRNVSGSRTP